MVVPPNVQDHTEVLETCLALVNTECFNFVDQSPDYLDTQELDLAIHAPADRRSHRLAGRDCPGNGNEQGAPKRR